MLVNLRAPRGRASGGFKTRFSGETKQNQWYQELNTLRQGSNESVDDYTYKFRMLVDRVNLTDAAQEAVGIYGCTTQGILSAGKPT